MTIHGNCSLGRCSVRHREKRKSFAKRKQTLSRFPKRPDPLVRPEEMEKRLVSHRLPSFIEPCNMIRKGS